MASISAKMTQKTLQNTTRKHDSKKTPKKGSARFLPASGRRGRPNALNSWHRTCPRARAWRQPARRCAAPRCTARRRWLDPPRRAQPPRPSAHHPQPLRSATSPRTGARRRRASKRRRRARGSTGRPLELWPPDTSSALRGRAVHASRAITSGRSPAVRPPPVGRWIALPARRGRGACAVARSR